MGSPGNSVHCARVVTDVSMDLPTLQANNRNKHTACMGPAGYPVLQLQLYDVCIKGTICPCPAGRRAIDLGRLQEGDPMTDETTQGAELPEICINHIIHNSTGLAISDHSIQVRGKTLKDYIKCLEYLRKNKYISSQSST